MSVHLDKIRTAIELLRSSRFSQAEPLFKQVLELEPTHPDALHGLSVIAFGRGDKQEAETLLRQLFTSQPERVSAKYDLACMLIEQKRDDEALTLLHEVIQASRAHASAWYQQGFVLRSQARLDEAQESLTQCLNLVPHHAPAVGELARVFRDRGDYQSALNAFDKAAVTAGAEARLFHTWWQFLSMSALAKHGPNAVRAGIKRFPNDADLRMDLAQALEELGEREAAITEYRVALKIDPNRGAAIGSLIAVLGRDAEQPLLAMGETIMADSRARPAAKAVIGYGVGKARHAKKEYGDAFRAWTSANAARAEEAGRLDRDLLVQQVESTLATFTPNIVAELSESGIADERPTLIVGMPRSGTTLVEQILSAHPSVAGLGELPDLPIVAEQFCRAHGRSGSWPPMDRASSAKLVRVAADHYLSVLDFRATGSSSRVIDKSPLNFFNVGLLAMMFPKARVIWCRRDPRDVCLSIFGENFASSQKYATDLSDLAFYYRQHEILMAHWHTVLGDRLLEVSYEALVGAQEPQSKRLVSFAGLDWDDRCLEFHRNERAVQTPSKWQVRQPMYSSAVARWRAYEQWLSPLLDEFGAEEQPSSA